MTLPASALAAAEATLTDTCTITRPGTATYTAGAITEPPATAIYTGACSIGPPSTGTSTTGADPKLVDARILRLPVTTADLYPGDIVTVTGHGVFTVERQQSRTTEHLRRIRVLAVTDAELVPR